MKKFGFTLAEVLITLGIIGVVAALTAPALVQNAGTAKIGPTLSKVVATLENAHEQLLHDEEASDLAKIAETSDEYFELLAKYISGGSFIGSNSYKSNRVIFTPTQTFWNKQPSNIDWSKYIEFKFSDDISLLTLKDLMNSDTGAVGSYKGRFTDLYIDINGIKRGPNIMGKDIFYFDIDRSGQVVPWGSSAQNFRSWGIVPTYDDDNAGSIACTKDNVGDGKGCAASIFENNLKVIYQ